MNARQTPLQPLHADASLIAVELAILDRLTTETLTASLAPATMLDGHHRVYLMRARGVDVDALPRKVIDGAL